MALPTSSDQGGWVQTQSSSRFLNNSKNVFSPGSVHTTLVYGQPKWRTLTSLHPSQNGHGDGWMEHPGHGHSGTTVANHWSQQRALSMSVHWEISIICGMMGTALNMQVSFVNPLLLWRHVCSSLFYAFCIGSISEIHHFTFHKNTLQAEQGIEC